MGREGAVRVNHSPISEVGRGVPVTSRKPAFMLLF
jgi:hypothetical protein